jgi:hypothetical protein
MPGGKRTGAIRFMKERRDAEHDQRDRRVPRLREIWERFSSRASNPPPFEPNPATMSSRYSMEAHWFAGREDVDRTSNHCDRKDRTRTEEGVKVLDLMRDLDTDPKERAL